MRYTDLSAATLTAFGNAVQRPAWLLQIGWTPTPSRLSSFDTVNFASNTWVQAGMDLTGVRISGASVSGSIKLDNADDGFSSLILGQGVVDKLIRIYAYDATTVSGGVLAAEDAVLLVDCSGGRAIVKDKEAVIELRDSSAYAFTPRKYVNQPSFTTLIPAGSKVTLNGQIYEINR